MTRQLLYQYHLLLSFSTLCHPSKGNIALSVMHHAIASLKRPHSTGGNPFTRKRTTQPHRTPGAGKEEANFTRPNFPKDGRKHPPHLKAMCRCTRSARHGNRSHLFMLEEN